MKVKDVMVSEVASCTPDSSAESVALAMWDHDCGCIPVVDEHNKPTGIVTDRDITLTAAQQNRPLRDIKARDIADGRKVVCCREDDEIHTALEVMRRNCVRRLPVVDDSGHLKGILALGDIFSVAGTGSAAKLPLDDTLGILQSVSGHHLGVRQTPAGLA